MALSRVVNYGYRKCAIHIGPLVCVQQSLAAAVDKFHIIHLIPQQVQVPRPQDREAAEIAASSSQRLPSVGRGDGGEVTNYT